MTKSVGEGGCQKLSQRQGSEASDAGYTGELCGEGQAVYAFAPAAVARRHTFGGFNEQRFLASCAVSTQHGAGRHSDSFFYAAGLMGRHRRTYAHTHTEPCRDLGASSYASWERERATGSQSNLGV